MTGQHFRKTVVACTSVLALAACGGGGGGGMNFIPPPSTPSPASPAGQTAFTIIPGATAQTFASVGTSTSTVASPTDARFGPISTADVDQVHIRYTAGGTYEIQLPGAGWDTLIVGKGVVPASADEVNTFQPAAVAQNAAGLITEEARHLGYQYSELANWFDHASDRTGWVAFGEPTLASNMPITGSATYDGVVHGMSDINASDPFDGPFRLPVDGTVQLNFNFGAGKLAGSMTLSAYGGMNPEIIGTMPFAQTVFAAGSTTYSGQFDTNVSGTNFFHGQFTGPNAQETTGAWALPFIYTNGSTFAPADGKVHQAIGAWIAKSH